MSSPATAAQKTLVQDKQALAIAAVTDATNKAATATAAATAAHNAAVAANEVDPASVTAATSAATAATNAAAATNTSIAASTAALGGDLSQLAQAAADAAAAANAAAALANTAKQNLDTAVTALSTPPTATELAAIQAKQTAAVTAAADAATKATAATLAATAAHNAAVSSNVADPASVATANTAATNANAAAKATALDVISSAAQADNASSTTLTAAVYAQAGVLRVDANNLDVINNALNTAPITGASADTSAHVQAVVDAYTKVLAQANGSVANLPANAPARSDYVNLGVNLGSAATDATTDAETFSLFNDIVANRLATDVNTIAKIDNLARIANAIELTAADGTPSVALTTADLVAIGIATANTFTANQLSNFLRIVAAAVNDGSATASLSQLQTIAAGDLTSPNAPVVQLGAGSADNGVNYAESLAGVIWVSAEQGSTITVTFTQSATNTVTKTITNATGNLQAVSLDLLADLAIKATSSIYGTINASVVAIDAAGNSSAPVTTPIYTNPGGAVYLNKVAIGEGGFVVNGEALGLQSGYSVSSAGDVNGDGLDDFIVGTNTTGTTAGKSYVVFGQTATTPIDLGSLGTKGFAINGLIGDINGISVSNVGDMNGDGLADLLVGAKGTSKSYVVFGQTGPTPVDLANLGSQGFVLNGVAGQTAGSSVSSAGDVNGDGLADVIVGDPYFAGNIGKSYVVFGQTGKAPIDLANLGNQGFAINAPASGANNRIGYSVSGAGDVNGDGLADVIVGAYALGVTSLSYVVFGQTGTSQVNLDTLGSRGFSIMGNSNDVSNSGYSVSSAGDVNGDGLADLLVAAPGAKTSYVVFGQTRGSSTVSLETLGSQGFAITGDAFSGYFVSNAGDVNGDGLADLLVSGRSASNEGICVVYGKTDATQVNLTSVANGVGGFRMPGVTTTSVSNAGDVNGDGFADFLVGAPVSNISPFVSDGKTYVIFGGSHLAGAGTTLVDFVGTASAEIQTGTTAAETFMAGDGNDTLIGNGGADVMHGGKGNDTLVVNAANITALASKMGAGGNTDQLALADGGSGFDTLRLATGAGNLDLTAVSNVDAMSGSGTSRINSIERIDMATDAGVNTLTLAAKDVNDMAGMNLIHTTTASADGNTWINVSGTALSATTQFHQLVVDGGSNDVVNLKTGIGTWTNAGTVSNGSTYVVWQNTSTNSQVLVKSGVTVNSNVAPVVMDLNGDGQLSYSYSVMDVNGDGLLDATAWAAPQDGVLVWDKYHDGQVHDNSQYAFTQYGGDTDLKGLAAAFDTNHDGELNAQDAKFVEFKVWQDLNQDGVSDAGEVRSLSDWGVTSIHLVSDGVQRTPAAGVTEAGRTTASTTTGTAMLVADAAFDFSSVIAQHVDKTPVDVTGASANVLKINLQDVLQGESSSPTPINDLFSAAAFNTQGGVAQLLPDPYPYLYP